MAAPAVIAKVAITVVTDKKLRNAVLGIILGIIIIIIAPVIILTSIISGGNAIDWNSPEVKQQVIDNMTDEQKAKLQAFETVFVLIEDELKNQQITVDPIKAQVIYLCALEGKEKDNPTFYSDYASCFKDVQDDNQIFENVTAKFGVTFTDDEKQKIITLHTKAIESQTLAPNSLHNEVAEMIKNDATPLSEGDFLSPFHGLDWKSCLSSGYGKRVDPVTGEEGASHTGLDLAAPLGTEIYSSKPGKVLLVRESADGYGKHIVIYHGGGYATLYGHCSEILVNEGAEVTTDTVIAKVGSTGKSTGNHCHFEIIINGQPVNPKNHLK